MIVTYDSCNLPKNLKFDEVMDLIKGSFNTSRNMDNVINARNITTAKEPADQRKIYAVDVENQATKDNLALILSNAQTMTKLLEKMTEHIYLLD